MVCSANAILRPLHGMRSDSTTNHKSSARFNVFEAERGSMPASISASFLLDDPAGRRWREYSRFQLQIYIWQRTEQTSFNWYDCARISAHIKGWLIQIFQESQSHLCFNIFFNSSLSIMFFLYSGVEVGSSLFSVTSKCSKKFLLVFGSTACKLSAMFFFYKKISCLWEIGRVG